MKTLSSVRIPVPEGFALKKRPNRGKLPIEEMPDSYTLEQLLVHATMKKYGLNEIEVAGILNLNPVTVGKYMISPLMKSHQVMPPNIPQILEDWCKANRKPLNG